MQCKNNRNISVINNYIQKIFNYFYTLIRERERERNFYLKMYLKNHLY